MKAGRTLQELASELERQSKTKKDYLADTRKLHLEVKDDKLVLEGLNGGMPLRDHVHGQLSTVLSIPKPYYDRMLVQEPDLLATNVNRWLHREPAKRLIRTLDGEVRAVLSDRYRPLDNLDLAEAVLPKLSSLEAQVVSGEITENRFYLKAVTPKVEGKIAKGDVIQAGIVISNSEIGQGSLRIEALDYRLICLNGMIREQAIRKAHLGRGGNRGQDAIEDASAFFRSETRQADDRAFFLKVQDSTSAMFDAVRFRDRIKQYTEAKGWTIDKDDPADVVEAVVSQFQMSKEESKSVMSYLIRGGDLSQWGLANAVTRASQDESNYDRATELEAIGGRIIEMGKCVR